MMSAKMGTVNDEDMIRMAFRVLDKDGRGTIKSSAFKHLMTHIGGSHISLYPHISDCGKVFQVILGKVF